MSSILDPRPGDGPNKGDLDPSDRDDVTGSASEGGEEEGRGEGGRGEGVGRKGGAEPGTSSKGINPVQHSE